MSKAILANVRLFAGGTDLTGVANQVEIAGSLDAKNATTFGSVDAAGRLWMDNLGGLLNAELSASGFWEAGSASFVDDDMWANFGGVGPWSTSGPGGDVSEGAPAYLLNALRTSYSALGQVGEIAPFSGAATSTGSFAKGATLLTPSTARTVTGTGAVVNLGAVPAGKAMRAALHVVSIAGTTPTFAAILQSAAAVGFASPTTRATFQVVNGAAGTRSAEYVSSAVGPITDAFWRISFTITGTTPSYIAWATAGIA